MAGPGRAPKPVLTRPNDQARREAELKRVTSDDVLRGPELPDGDWHPQTVQWWDHWRRSPQAKLMTVTDWDVLAETAIFHTRLWQGEVSVGPELRLRVSKFGATVEDRLRLKMTLDDDLEAMKKAASPAAVPSDRKRRLLRAVNDGA
jgi:hypothetical protein